MEIEYVDAEGIKNGVAEPLRIPLAYVPRMKMKDVVRNYFGNNFDDEDSTESFVLYAMEDFHKWYVEQMNLIKEQV